MRVLQHQHNNPFNTPARFDVSSTEAINALAVAVIASLASFLNRKGGADGQPPKFSWYTFAAHLSASVISALLSRAIATELGVKSDNILTIVAGISGWAGVSGVNWLIAVAKAKVLMFTGLDKTKLRFEDESERPARRTYREEYEPSEELPVTSSARNKKPFVGKDSDNVPHD